MSDKNAIDVDLDLVILEKEYPKLKEALEMKYSDIGYEEVKRAINEISSRTFTASRLLARMQHKLTMYTEGMYDIIMSKYRSEARDKLEKIWKDEKKKATLTEKIIEDYVLSHYAEQLMPIKRKIAKLQRDISVLKSLHRRLEGRESLLQTYSRLHEKRTQLIMSEKNV